MVSNLSLALVSEFEIHIAIFNDTQQIIYPFAGSMHPIVLPFSKNTLNNSFLVKILRFVILTRKLRKLKRNNKIDVSVSFMEASNFANFFSSRNERLIFSVRTILSREMKHVKFAGIFGFLVRHLYHRADGIVVPSHGSKADLISYFSLPDSKIHVIHNFIDLVMVESKARESLGDLFYDEIFRKKVLINVGRLDKVKGQIYLLSILKAVRETVTDAKLVIIGEGTLKSKIKEEAAKFNLRVYDNLQEVEKNMDPGAVGNFEVFLLGAKDNPFKYLSRSSVFVFTSIYEGFPNVMLEAMSCGLPVVSADCYSGPGEILSNGTQEPGENVYQGYGILLPELTEAKATPSTFEQEQWASPISRLLLEKDLHQHYSSQSLLRVRQFDQVHIIEAWKRLLRTKFFL